MGVVGRGNDRKKQQPTLNPWSGVWDLRFRVKGVPLDLGSGRNPKPHVGGKLKLGYISQSQTVNPRPKPYSSQPRRHLDFKWSPQQADSTIGP